MPKCQMCGDLFTVNEARAARGLPALPGLDRIGICDRCAASQPHPAPLDVTVFTGKQETGWQALGSLLFAVFLFLALLTILAATGAR